MPKEIPLVSETSWQARAKSQCTIFGSLFERQYILEKKAESMWVSAYGPFAWFTEACRQKLLAAMDSFGKVEEPKYWELLARFSKEPSAIYAKSLLELRSRIEKLEGKVKS